MRCHAITRKGNLEPVRDRKRKLHYRKLTAEVWWFDHMGHFHTAAWCKLHGEDVMVDRGEGGGWYCETTPELAESWTVMSWGYR